MWSIEASGEGFLLTRDGVTLKIPATLAGIRALHATLLNWTPGDKIATSGFPTQTQLADLISAFQRTVPEPQFKLNLEDLF
jgi:hypothetical protein